MSGDVDHLAECLSLAALGGDVGASSTLLAGAENVEGDAASPSPSTENEDEEDGDDDGASDHSSLNTEEREELEEKKAEERVRVAGIFDWLASADGDGESIPKDQFHVLIDWALGTTYCEEEHRRTLKKLGGEDGKIHKDAFLDWYISWMYDEDNEDAEYSDASKAAREALAPYGTTPEKSAEASATKLRGERASRLPQKKPEPPKAAARPPPSAQQKSSSSSSSSSAGAFLPMSTKAPTPFSEKGLSSSSKAKSGAAAAAAAFPPMATKGPTPFGQSAAPPKPKNDKVEPKAAAPTTFSVKSRTPSSLFGSPTPPAKVGDKGSSSSAKKGTERGGKADTATGAGSKPFSSAFGGFGGLADALSSAGSTNGSAAATTPSADKSAGGAAAPPSGGTGLFGAPKPTAGTAPPAPPLAAAAPSSGEQRDYNEVLTEFYQKYNPTKLGEVARTLENYKGREREMFDKLARKNSVANPLDNDNGSSQPLPSPSDYHSILTEFYQKVNPSKVPEAAKHLERYKGREPEMFAKLAKKYNVPNPLQTAAGSQPSQPPQAGPSSSRMSMGSMGSSLFGSGSDATPSKTPFPSAAGPSPSPFGTLAPAPAPVASPSPFGGAPAPGPAAAPSPFGGGAAATSPSPFGAPKAAPSPFGQPAGGAPTSTPFGAAAPSPSPFGQALAPPGAAAGPSPFGLAAPAPPSSGAPPFGGKNPRDILVDFYQKRNPTKVGEVDKLLAKYAGQEEQLFRNLAKKYGLDPAVFGVSAVPAAAAGGPAAAAAAASPFGAQPGGMAASVGGFGQTSALGGMGGGAPTSHTPFGKPSTLGGGTPFGSPSGGGAFGASAAGGATSGFGGLAAAGGGASSGFGGGAPGGGGFGSPAGGGGFGASGATGGFGAASPGGFGALGGLGGGGGFGAPAGGGCGGGMAPAPSPFGAARR